MGQKSKSLEGIRPKEDGKKPVFVPKTHVVTAAQAIQSPRSAHRYGRNTTAGEPHKAFVKQIERYCDRRNAELTIQAIRGSYASEIELNTDFRKSQFSHKVYMETPVFRRLQRDRAIEREIREGGRGYNDKTSLFWENIPWDTYKTLNFKRLNKEIAIIDPQTPPQNKNPATGNMELPQQLGLSVIMPHPLQMMAPVSKSLDKGPRLLLSTGCCTHPNYNETNARGKKSKRNHQYGFCVVDVLEDKLYLPRLVRAHPDGSFVDMGIRYAPGKKVAKVKTKAMVIGDVHVPFEDKIVKKATFEMIDYFRPEEIYLHDMVDFYPIAHHNIDDGVWRMWLAEAYKTLGYDAESLETHLQLGLEYLKEISKFVGKKATINIPPDNHSMFLHKWLGANRHVKDPKNRRIGSTIDRIYRKGDNPLEAGLKAVGDIPKNVRFLGLTEDKRHWGYECGSHGHLGPNGARGNLNNHRVSYGKGIIGHVHSLEVLGDAISVGTNSIIPLEYQEGHPSRSMHGNAVIYDGGFAQALPIILGHWKPNYL